MKLIALVIKQYNELFKNQIAADLTYEKVSDADQAEESKNESANNSIYDSAPNIHGGLKAHARFK